MIKLSCDKCGYECGWYLTDGVPPSWLRVDSNELCGKCAEEYNKCIDKLQVERDTKIKAFFDD